VLRYAIVREVDLAESDVVTRLDERVKKVKDISAASSSHEALDVLKHHHWRPYFGRETRIDADEGCAVIGRVAPTG
jgi:hypothetical protein